MNKSSNSTNTVIHRTIAAVWKNKDATTVISMHHASRNDIITRAIQFGYVEPTWYTPWRYFNQLCITVF